MNNLEELMKSADKLKYSKKEKKNLIAEAYSILGEETYLTICMEEIAELIEVTSESINNKADYIHLTEELVDVVISIEIMKLIFNIDDSEIDKVDKKKSKKSSVLISSIQGLAKSQQNISKFIRCKEGAIHKIVPALNNMNEAVYYISTLFKIKKKDMDKIELLKYHRLEERINLGTLQ